MEGATKGLIGQEHDDHAERGDEQRAARKRKAREEQQRHGEQNEHAAHVHGAAKGVQPGIGHGGHGRQVGTDVGPHDGEDFKRHEGEAGQSDHHGNEAEEAAAAAGGEAHDGAAG